MKKLNFRAVPHLIAVIFLLLGLNASCATVDELIVVPSFPNLDVSLSYNCTLPSNEVESVAVRLKSDSTPNLQNPPYTFKLSAEFEFGSGFTNALRESGATNIIGIVDTDITIHTDYLVQTSVTLPLTLEANSLEQPSTSGSTPFIVKASGSGAAEEPTSDTVALSAGEDLYFYIKGQTADGSISAAPFDDLAMPCVLETPAGGSLSPVPSSLTFGSVGLGEQYQMKIQLQNGTPNTVYISQLELSQSGKSVFFVEEDDADRCRSLAPSRSCSLFVNFAPLYQGAYSVELKVTSNLGETIVPINGEGIIVDSFCEPSMVSVAINSEVVLADSVTTLVTGVYEGDIGCPEDPILSNWQLQTNPFEMPLNFGLFPNLKTNVQWHLSPTATPVNISDSVLEAEFYLYVPSVTVNIFGFKYRVGGGEQCRTQEPVTLRLVNGYDWVAAHGTIANIGKFESCGSATRWLNRNLSGPTPN